MIFASYDLDNIVESNDLNRCRTGNGAPVTQLAIRVGTPGPDGAVFPEREGK